MSLKQEFVRYAATAALFYLTQLVYFCPCEIIIACHVPHFFVTFAAVGALVAANIFF